MASFGENLRRERELRGVELREMAEATKISLRFLQALEQDRVDILPGGIFPKAFVRQYAKHLGLDPERVVAEFVYAHGGDPVPARGVRAPVRVDQGGLPRGVILLAVTLGLLGLVGWKVRGQAGRSSIPAPPSIAAPPATTFAHDRVYPPPSGTAIAPAVAPGAMVLGLSVRRSSWVEAKVDGTTVLNRVMKEGETQRLEARQEAVLSFGNAGGVAVTLNERPLAPMGAEGEVKRGVVINAQTAPALLAGSASAPSPGASLSAPSPRPAAPRPRSPQPASPSPSPSPSVLLIAPRASTGLGSSALLPPPAHPSPSPGS